MQLILPLSVKGMTELDREQFTQTITVPYIHIPVECFHVTGLKDILLILQSFKNVRDLKDRFKQVLLDPDIVKTRDHIIQHIPSIRKYVEESFDFTDIKVTYENYTIEQVIKAIIPDDLIKEKAVNNGSGYSLIGHIAHFNLRDEVLLYKHIIAQVVLDKLPNVKTVVNKLHEIDSVYRNFELEILAGDRNTIVRCWEGKSVFQFDLAKVYWNPRLSAERERIVGILHPHDVMFDIFAGVGPFVVPALKLGCTIYANDLNPECFKWLGVNLKKNQPKKSLREYYIYNLDGREFLKAIVLPQIELYQNQMLDNDDKSQSVSNRKIVLLMNLPEIALTFLDTIYNWLTINPTDKEKWSIPIHIYCYAFSRATDRADDVRTRLVKVLPNINFDHVSYRFVRQVAPNKDMMCTHIRLFDNNKQGDQVSMKNIETIL